MSEKRLQTEKKKILILCKRFLGSFFNHSTIWKTYQVFFFMEVVRDEYKNKTVLHKQNRFLYYRIARVTVPVAASVPLQ